MHGGGEESGSPALGLGTAREQAEAIAEAFRKNSAEALADVLTVTFERAFATLRHHEEALGETTEAMRQVVEKLVSGMSEALKPAPAEPRGPNGEQLVDREYPMVRKGTRVSELVQAVLTYRKERDDARAELKKLRELVASRKT